MRSAQFAPVLGVVIALEVLKTTGLAAASTTSPATTVAVSTHPANESVLAAVQRPEGDLPEEQLERSLAERAASLIKAVDQQADGAAAAVDAAEYILVRQMEPALSRELLGTANGVDRQFIRKRSQVVSALLDRAQKQSKHRSEHDHANLLAERIDAARSYAALFAAIAAEPSASRLHAPTTGLSSQATTRSVDPRAARLVEACRGLASLVDASRADMAASARLWQAAAYRRAGRSDRALKVLPAELNAPKALPFEFFERLERCRALADRGDYVAAQALAIRIESRVDAWFPEAHRAAARAAVRSLRGQLWRQWAADLESDGATDQAAASRAEADRISASGAGHGLYRLEASVGGVDVPLNAPREAARILDVICDDPLVVIVLHPTRAKPTVWTEARQAVCNLLGRLNTDQSFALIATQDRELHSYPNSPFATARAEQAADGVNFAQRVRPDSSDSKRLSDALLRALALKPSAVVLVTSQEIDESFAGDLAKLLREAKVKLHVLWLGDPEKSRAAKGIAAASAGEFRPLSPSATTQTDSEVEPEEDQPP